jgi:hypothetical protein
MRLCRCACGCQRPVISLTNRKHRCDECERHRGRVPSNQLSALQRQFVVPRLDPRIEAKLDQFAAERKAARRAARWNPDAA